MKSNELRPAFSFMGSTAGYAQYYLSFERLRDYVTNRNKLAKIPGVGDLRPLRKKYLLHSYWRYFRLPAEKAKWAGRPNTEDDMFFLLPLEISIPVNPIGANNRTLNAKAFAHLFPFGSCIINLEIKLSNISLVDFVNIIPNIKRASINRAESDQKTPDSKNFSRFSQDIAIEIAGALFGSQRTVVPFDVHTLLFVRKMAPPDFLQIWADPHRKAIAAAMTGQTYDNISSIKNVSDCFSAELAPKRRREILLFNPKGSFFYASPDWQRSSPEMSPEDIELLRKYARCMQRNYLSCLNVLFAVNRFLKECKPSQHPEVPKERLDTTINCIQKAFLVDPSHIYFKHAFEKIAPVIGLDQALKEL